ncbi:MAG: 16S rRNA (adenine(1518)-N(6)/adenine(1519)-N(6))-dimethyltransferase RsmA [Geminicoccaceae bacterium]|nr:MAG: 16S rRNA (adenine(1518)-N(6)/adenine(1519)-N(6))-dimethyltransferase RsmA [Geminicoccaceae bacterium]
MSAPLTAGLPSLKATIEATGLRADKSLGQHFLTDPAILGRIAEAAGPLHDLTVLEVGPGPGGLTRALLDAGAQRVVAIERDPRCVAALQPLVDAAGGRLLVLAGDALALDHRRVVSGPCTIAANLPYNIGTELIVRWLRVPADIQRLVVLVQKEVGQRLQAQPGTSAYGRLAVLAQWASRVEGLFDLPPGAFQPPPKVHSRLMRLTPYPSPPIPARLHSLERITAAAFGQRRKMLKTSLKAAHPDSLALCTLADIDPTRRAETLDLQAFATLANALDQLTSQGPDQR